jgi:predicted dehydrogenase
MPRSTLTRRTVLRRAALAAAAPWIVPAGALARGLRSPGERITLGIIGVGNMGGGHVDSLSARDDVQIVAICDVDAEKRRSAREKIEKRYAERTTAGTFKGCAEFNEFERVLERPDIDAVLIAVPDHWHAIIAIRACQVGKDVYCEKPLSLTIREAEAMVAAARAHGRVFQTGSQQRSMANFRFACEMVRSGRIGKLQTVNVGIAGPSRDKQFEAQPAPPGLDWERWLGPAPWSEYNAERCSGSYSGGWRHVRDYSGGMTTDWGAHHYDIAQWGMGMDGGGPVEIIPPSRIPDVTQTPDPAKGESLVFHYASGVKMIHGGANGVLFTGTAGTIEVNRGYLKTNPDFLAREPIGPTETHLYESADHHTNWLECIRSRRRPICDVEIGASSITVCHLANIAFWTGRTIRWDAARREIVGDALASRWLDRPRRLPWLV